MPNKIPLAGQQGKRLDMLSALPFRGGAWGDAAAAGLFTLGCSGVRAYSSSGIAARPDSMPRTLQKDCGLKGGAFLHWARAFAKSAGHPFTSRHHVVLDRLGVIL